MDSPGGEDISRPLVEKVAPHKNGPKRKQIVLNLFI